MEKENNYNYESIKALCQEYRADIMARKELGHVLNGKRVRFVDKEGRFGYAKFGEFFFRSMGVMMLITKDTKYTWYHEPDCMGDSFLSTVPVLYAGVETGFKDDCYNPIFTGDIVTVRRGLMKYTLMVRWLPDCEFPGLAADNHEVLFEPGDKYHIEGNVFYDIKPDHFDVYDYWSYKDHNAVFLYYPNYSDGPNDEKLDQELTKAARAPYFEGSTLSVVKYPRMYEPGSGTLQIKESDVLFGFSRGTSEDENGEEFEDMMIDFIPELSNCKNKCESLFVSEFDPDWDSLKHDVTEFLLTAHRHPETRYVVLGWEKSVENKKVSKGLCDLFRPVYDYSLTNIILPGHVMCKFVAEDSVGLD